MKTIFRLFVVVLLAGGWALAAAALHLVRTPGPIPMVGNLILFPKGHLTYHDTYVDTTAWTAGDIAEHPAVAERLAALNKMDVLKHIGNAAPQVTAHEAVEAAPATQPAKIANVSVAN